MLTAEARVETERASRYLDQLCRHAQQMGRHPHYRQDAHGGADTRRHPAVHHVEWSDTDGTVRTSLGRWTLQATPDALVLHVEAANEEKLQRMRDLIAARVEKIGRRDNLTVAWRQPEVSGALPGTGDQADAPHAKEHHGHAGGMTRRWTVRAVVGVVALMGVAHLVLGGSVLAASQWLGWGAGAVVVAVVLVKVIGMGGFVAHHRRRRAR
ncbi:MULTISPECIES: DUF2218 domain-containing protein [Streptomyces]|uniref:DUF2218 domain-containing protein n=1 Tax=Streptomyces zinciresistens K42 TaxID=700597 RepID=G2G5X2_9ACTN|nr:MULTISPECIES: DUF2218 domain-containing protein [Streptomyces]EGX61061.1 hypothetical protein SZN_04381 [Streptomyces zinciresistens K42]MDT9696585.1 DUF2218 domain-containing protein [Streptomyces sp. P17]